MYSVAVIDDNKIAVEAIVKSTNWGKYNCNVAGVAYDGVSGLELIRGLSPAVVIIDIQMPGFNGLDVICKVRKENPGIRFIIISGYSHFEYARQALRYGVKDYLLKPVMVEELEEALMHVVQELQNKKAEEEPEDELEALIQKIRFARSHYSKMVAGAIEYVDRNLQKNITQSDVCKELLVSTGHFSKCFKRETGVGFNAYVSMLKMYNARILLKNPKNRVNEVARMLGYHDYAYFFQVFKKQFGYAPRDIKMNQKKEEKKNEDAGE